MSKIPYIFIAYLTMLFQILQVRNVEWSVKMKSTIFWDITLCSPLGVNRRFGGTYRLHLQGWKNKLSTKPAWKQVASSCWWRYVPPKHLLALNGLHRIISQKMVLFITTAVRTANPTKSEDDCAQQNKMEVQQNSPRGWLSHIKLAQSHKAIINIMKYIRLSQQGTDVFLVELCSLLVNFFCTLVFDRDRLECLPTVWEYDYRRGTGLGHVEDLRGNRFLTLLGTLTTRLIA
jgi:hypothetical protein